MYTIPSGADMDERLLFHTKRKGMEATEPNWQEALGLAVQLLPGATIQWDSGDEAIVSTVVEPEAGHCASMRLQLRFYSTLRKYVWGQPKRPFLSVRSNTGNERLIDAGRLGTEELAQELRGAMVQLLREGTGVKPATASLTVNALNAAFRADPAAVHALLCNHAPCNQALAEDPYVPVQRVPVLAGERFSVDALGLVNAVLLANGLPMVALKWEGAEGAPRRLAGFEVWEPPAQPAT